MVIWRRSITSGHTQIFSQLHPPLLVNEHKHPFGIKNPKLQCFFNSVLQLIFSIFWNNSYTSPYNSSMEGTLLKCLFHTAPNARHSKYVDTLKFQLVRDDIFYNGQNQQDSTECLLMLINIIHKGSLPDSNSTTYRMGAFLSDILFSFVLQKYIVCDVCGLRSPLFESSSVLYISPTDTSSMQTWFYKDCNRNCKNPVLDVIRTLGTSNQAIYYNLLNIYLSSLIDLDTLIIMSPKIDAPYLWIRPLDLVPLNLAYGLLKIIMDHLYIPVIILHLSIVARKHSIATITQLWSLELLTAKTPQLHILYYVNWLTHDFWTRTGGWEYDRSHGTGTSSPSHWQQVEEQAPKPVGWMMYFLLMTFVPIQKLCVNIYLCSSIWILFSLVYQFCLALWW